MTLTRRIILTLGVILVFQLWLAMKSSPAQSLGPSLYELTDQSGYVEGCFDPCMCPIFFNPTLTGSFMLTAVSQGDGALFLVTEVEWQFAMGGETILVTGSGQYVIEGEQHQMVLDLFVGDAPLEQYDSGLVPLEGDLQGIVIAIAMNDFFCYDQVFYLDAVPAPVDETVSSWGSLKSIYR
jgi:hypothetical protein